MYSDDYYFISEYILPCKTKEQSMMIAMFLKYEKEKGIFDKNIIHVLIFEVSGGNILNVEQEYLYDKNINYISLWLLNKRIKEVYIRNVDKKTRDFFIQIGVLFKSYEELENKKLFGEHLE